MGAAADRKVTEIEVTRRELESDLLELEERLPTSIRSLKSLVGLVLGSTALTLFVAGRFRGQRPKGRSTQEVVVRIVRDDL